MRTLRKFLAIQLAAIVIATGLIYAPPAAAHGAAIDLSTSIDCQRNTGSVRVTWTVPKVFTNPSNQWSYIAFGLWGERANQFSPTYGWQGYVNWGGSGGIWTAAYGNGYHGVWDFGTAQYRQTLAADVAVDTFNTASNFWYVGITVWWPDGHQEFFWLQAPYYEAC